MSAVNPLANPKGVKLLCHLCPRPAREQCGECRVTYYCSADHQDADWDAIHEEICPLIAALRAPLPHANSEVERKHRKQRQAASRTGYETREQLMGLEEHIISIALTQSRKYLYQGDFVSAFPPSLLALKLLKETYGPAHMELSPALLVLAEAAIGQKHLRDAEQYLSQAQWSIMQATPSAPPDLHSQLQRRLGLLAAARGELQAARRYFAEDIYNSSVAHGPYAIETAGGFFHLASVFALENKPSVAVSLHHQVVSSWQCHLQGMVDELERAVKQPPSLLALPGTASPLNSVPKLNIAHQVEALHELQGVLSLGSLCPPSLAQACHYTLALLHTNIRDYHQALACCRRAQELAGEGSQTTADAVQKLMEIIGLFQQSATANNQQT